jgi:hypothetical protein
MSGLPIFNVLRAVNGANIARAIQGYEAQFQALGGKVETNVRPAIRDETPQTKPQITSTSITSQPERESTPVRESLLAMKEAMRQSYREGGGQGSALNPLFRLDVPQLQGASSPTFAYEPEQMRVRVAPSALPRVERIPERRVPPILTSDLQKIVLKILSNVLGPLEDDGVAKTPANTRPTIQVPFGTPLSLPLSTKGLFSEVLTEQVNSILRAIVPTPTEISSRPTPDLMRFVETSPLLNQSASLQVRVPSFEFPVQAALRGDLSHLMPSSVSPSPLAPAPSLAMRDMSAMVALFASSIPGWPVEKPKTRETSQQILNQYGRSLRELSQDELAQLLSRSGASLALLDVIKKMIRDLDDQIDDDTLDAIVLAALKVRAMVIEGLATLLDWYKGSEDFDEGLGKEEGSH